MVIKKEILYPIFLECCQYTTETFWENIFEDIAYGKTPYGTYISKDFLCCNYKDKEFSYKIEHKDPKQLYTDVYNLLAKKLGLLSHKDKIKKRVDFYNIEQEIKESRKSWNNIRKKNVKDLFIENYVIAMKNKFELTIKQAKSLLSIIFIAMVFKVITCKDIHYSDGVITEIEGISFKKNKIILEKDIYNLESNFSPCILVDKSLISANWEKYLTNLKKLVL